MRHRLSHQWMPDFLPVKAACVCAVLWLTLVSELNADSLALLDGDVLFGRGELQLTVEGKRSLESLTQTLLRFDGILSIRIIGHTDDSGDEKTNMALSQRRADWLAKHFKRYFPGAHILSLGAGGSIPLANNLSAAGRARNHRVQVQAIASGNPAANLH
ncbi:MAG: OmpA family protein [Granulosicoccus sp.]